MKEVEITSVQCFLLRVRSTGEELGLMQLCSEWNGMMELRSVKSDGGMLVVDVPELHGFAATFKKLFPTMQSGNDLTGQVIKGSPDLLARLFRNPGEPTP